MKLFDLKQCGQTATTQMADRETTSPIIKVRGKVRLFFETSGSYGQLLFLSFLSSNWSISTDKMPVYQRFTFLTAVTHLYSEV